MNFHRKGLLQRNTLLTFETLTIEIFLYGHRIMIYVSLSNSFNKCLHNKLTIIIVVVLSWPPFLSYQFFDNVCLSLAELQDSHLW